MVRFVISTLISAMLTMALVCGILFVGVSMLSFWEDDIVVNFRRVFWLWLSMSGLVFSFLILVGIKDIKWKSR